MMTEQEAATLLEIHLPVYTSELDYAFTRRKAELHQQRENHLIDDSEAGTLLELLEEAYLALQAGQATAGEQAPQPSTGPAIVTPRTTVPIPSIQFEEFVVQDSEWGFADEIAYTVVDTPASSRYQTMKLPVIGDYVLGASPAGLNGSPDNALRALRLTLIDLLQARYTALSAPAVPASQPVYSPADIEMLVPDSIKMPLLLRIAGFLRLLIIILYVPLLIYWTVGLLEPPRSVTGTVESKFMTSGRLSSLFAYPHAVVVSWSQRPDDIEFANVSDTLYNSVKVGQKVSLTYDRMNVLVFPIPHTVIQVVLSIDGQPTAEPNQLVQWLVLCIPETLLALLLYVLLSYVTPQHTTLARVVAKVPMIHKGKGTGRQLLILEWPGPHRVPVPLPAPKAEYFSIDSPVRISYHYKWPLGDRKPAIAQIDSVRRVKEAKSTPA